MFSTTYENRSINVGSNYSNECDFLIFLNTFLLSYVPWSFVSLILGTLGVLDITVYL